VTIQNLNVSKLKINMTIILIKYKPIETMKKGENQRFLKTTKYLLVSAFIEI